MKEAANKSKIREYAKRGKAFERELEGKWKDSQGNVVQREVNVDLGKKRGRMDIFIDDDPEMVLVLEVKSTDWDKIKRGRLREYARRHLRQLHRYAEAILEQTGKSVTLGITYPKKPVQEDRYKDLMAVFDEVGGSISFEED